jgi:3-oxoacyl-[acyl-carrier-protein] synthase III
MLLTRFDNFKIAGISVAVPEKLTKVESFNDTFGEKVVADISAMTGIRSFRRTSAQQTASDLGFAAASSLLKNTKLDLNEIGLLLYITQKPDYRLPSTSYLIHSRLSLNSECGCFDINLACSGYVYGLHTAMTMLECTDKSLALIITGDTTTKTISPLDRTMMLLFGDSGTATLLQKTEEGSSAFSALRTDGSRFKAIITPSGAFRNRYSSRERIPWGDGIYRSDYDTHMKGMDVFGFSITDVPKLMKELMQALETTPDSYECFALHQPNMYMIRKIAHKIKIPDEKLLISIDRFGNNSSSSIPLVLADHYGANKSGVKRMLMSGFGSGLSWGCLDVYIDTENIYPIIYTDNFFSE